MTLCNMVIEGGGKNGIIEADDVTFDYVRARTGKVFRAGEARCRRAEHVFFKRWDAGTHRADGRQAALPDKRATARELSDVKLTRALHRLLHGREAHRLRERGAGDARQKVAVKTFLVPATTEISQGIRTETLDGKTAALDLRGCRLHRSRWTPRAPPASVGPPTPSGASTARRSASRPPTATSRAAWVRRKGRSIWRRRTPSRPPPFAVASPTHGSSSR